MTAGNVPAVAGGGPAFGFLDRIPARPLAT
jgi:hypothetical protein